MHDYTLFVDEAGDDKVDLLKPDHPNGNSEWLCIGGYLVREDQESDLERRRDEILVSFGGQTGGTLHYKNLKPKNRIATAKRLARMAREKSRVSGRERPETVGTFAGLGAAGV